jgi:ketosteroid isomerase-like protein
VPRPSSGALLSETNLEIARRLCESFQRRDNDYPFSVFDEEIVWDVTGAPEMPLPGEMRGVFHGHAGVRAFWSAWLDAWEAIDFDWEVVDLGDQVASLITRQRNHGRASGIWVDQVPYAMIWTIEDGRVKRLDYAHLEETRARAV